MNKKIILNLLLCVCLTSCSPVVSPQSGVDETISNNVDETTENSEADTKITYYEKLVNELQQELLEIKTALYANRVEYESKIEALEMQLVTSSPSNPSQNDEIDSDTIEADFLYDVIDNQIVITTYIGKKNNIEIPKTIKGYPVTKIGESAFANHANVKSVSIPDGMKEIGWFAFRGCIGLCRITIPSSVISIGYDAFQYCNQNLTIQCSIDSYARLYANSYGIAVIE